MLSSCVLFGFKIGVSLLKQSQKLDPYCETDFDFYTPGIYAKGYSFHPFFHPFLYSFLRSFHYYLLACTCITFLQL